MGSIGATTFDYIIAGGGTAGCVLASRLSQTLAGLSVALVEAGPDAHDNPTVRSPLGAPLLHNTELEWNTQTVPQKWLDGRRLYQTGGKLLSGSSAVNYGMWTRGPANDFDHWSNTVGDGKWGYQQLLPCFKRSETWYGTDKTNALHGFDGPIHSLLPDSYPMREILREAFQQAGVSYVSDANAGDPLGFSLFTSNWHNYARQSAGEAYDLSKVTKLTESPVSKVLLETDSSAPAPVTTGVVLKNGKVLRARKEVIVSCGSFGTPKLLMLSGLGDATHLKSLGIKSVIDIPEVGQNLHDHISTMVMWKLRHPEAGLAMGSPNFPKPRYRPSEWVYTDLISRDKLAEALASDDLSHPNVDRHRNLVNPGAHFEMTISYGPVGGDILGGDPPPVDGSIITTGCAVLVPTSRGSVTLTSLDPEASPAIDPNYLATEHDRCILREALRQSMRIMQTPAAKGEVTGLYVTSAIPEIVPDSSDEVLDAYLRKMCISWFHPAGTAAMGKVVDSSCRVQGVMGLRVVDASIFPFPLAAHYQCPVYAVAERAAEIIIGDL